MGAKAVALSIFGALAAAEAACHGVDVEEVHFHEIADWDSLADIVAAASLVATSGAATWSVADLPIGSGRALTQHGPVPIPAPATARLLEGFAVFDDGVAGERVTPTGAAILRSLSPSQAARPAGALLRTGVGAGTRDLPGVANICRLLVLETAAPHGDAVSEIAFEIDDMTPEEISVALDRIREGAGVVDAGYTLGYGKKGRARYAVTVLARAEAADGAADLCLAETSTLGVRIGRAARRVLARAPGEFEGVRTKTATRPAGRTAKAESDDLADVQTLKARRAVAHAAEQAAESHEE